ncbi:MAG: hypothetical protein ACPG19_06860 [Saprospiraceae bacterium]
MKRLLLLSVIVLSTMQLSAQSFFNLGNWQIKKAGIHLGMDMDMLNQGLNHEYFLSMSKEQTNSDFESMSFSNDNDMYSMVCENPNIRLEMSLVSPYFKNTEWRFALNTIINRIDAISYYNSDGYGNSDYLNFNSYGNELSLESVLLKSVPFMKFFEVHGGVGTNIGYSFGNSLDIYGSSSNYTANQLNFNNLNEVSNTVSSPSYEYFSEYYQLNNGINQRAFVQLGASMTVFNRIEMGFDARGGLGYRGVFGAPVAFTMLKAFSVSAKYVFQTPRKVPFTKVAKPATL